MYIERDDENNIKYCFSQYNYEINDVKKCLEYLKKNYCLFSFEEIIKRFCEWSDIKCPMEYLNTKYIYSGIQDNYFEINEDLFLDIELVFEDDNLIKEMEKSEIIKKFSGYTK